MGEIGSQLAPPRRLAVAYAPMQARDAFALLLAFDTRLAELVTSASEPMIGQLKLAWWRDAIEMEPAKRPKGEPLLLQLAVLDGHDVRAPMAQLIDAWEALLVGDGSAEALAASATTRGAAIFASYAHWVGSDADVDALGEAWAIADLTGRNEGALEWSTIFRNRKLRPLTILALSVRDVSGPRLLWHALTGR